MILAADLPAQTASRETTTYTYDLNGRRMPASTTQSTLGPGGGTAVERVRTVNGVVAPLESSTERVIAQEPGRKIVERVVLKFDQEGRPAGAERHIIEDVAGADGSVTTRVSIEDRDLNGRYMPRERSTTRSLPSGGTIRAETVIERPDLNGGYEVAEKRTTVTTGDDNNREREVSIYRRGMNGGFSEAARERVTTKVEDGRVVTTAVEYNAAATGKMEFAGQRISRREKQADGSEVEVIDVYGVTATAHYSGGAAGPRLREQQIIERKPADNSNVTETFRVRRPQTDSEKLGPAMLISEKVCTGACR